MSRAKVRFGCRLIPGAVLAVLCIQARIGAEIVLSGEAWDRFVDAGAPPGSQVPGPIRTVDNLNSLWMPRAQGVGGASTDKYILYMVRVEFPGSALTVRHRVQVVGRQVGDTSNGLTIRNLSIDPDLNPASQRSYISILMNDGGAEGPSLARDDLRPSVDIDPPGTIGRSGASVSDPTADTTQFPPDTITTRNATLELRWGLNLLRIDPTDPRDLPAFDPDTGWQAFSITIGPDDSLLRGEVVLPVRPEKPTLIRAERGLRQVTLEWIPPSTGPTPASYVVRRAETPGGPYIAIADATGTGYTDTAVDKDYCYVVRSKLGTQESDDSNELCAAGIPSMTFRRGNVNGDALVDITDAIGILGHLFPFLVPAGVVCVDAADIKDKGSIDISDAISVLNFLFQGGTAPAAPGPDVCGYDVNQEAPDLGCRQGC